MSGEDNESVDSQEDVEESHAETRSFKGESLEDWSNEVKAGYGSSFLPSDWLDETEKLSEADNLLREIPPERKNQRHSITQERLSNEIILDILEDASSLQEDTEKSLNDISEQQKELENLKQEIQDSHQEVTNTIGELEGKFNELQNQTRELEERAEDKITQFENTAEDIEGIKEEIQGHIDEVEELKQTASNLVKREAGASIGSEFAERKRELEMSLKWWKRASVMSISLLIISSIIIYRDISIGSIEGFTVLSKVALLLPISVAVWFTSSHYNRQKKLMEEYEFKANIALSLMGFREVLREELPDEEADKVGEFVVDTMDKIYSDPIEAISDSEQPYGRDLQGNGSVAELLKRL